MEVTLTADYNKDKLQLNHVFINELPADGSDAVLGDNNGVLPDETIGPLGIKKGTYGLAVWGHVKEGNEANFTLRTETKEAEYGNDQEANDSRDTAQPASLCVEGHIGYRGADPNDNRTDRDDVDWFMTYLMKGKIKVDIEWQSGTKPAQLWFYAGDEGSVDFGTGFTAGETATTAGTFTVDEGIIYAIKFVNQSGKWGGYTFSIRYVELDQESEAPRVTSVSGYDTLETIDVAKNYDFKIYFSEPIDDSTIQDNIHIVDNRNNQCPFVYTYEVVDNMPYEVPHGELTVTVFGSELKPNTEYGLLIHTDIKDDDETPKNLISQALLHKFQVGEKLTGMDILLRGLEHTFGKTIEAIAGDSITVQDLIAKSGSNTLLKALKIKINKDTTIEAGSTFKATSQTTPE